MHLRPARRRRATPPQCHELRLHSSAWLRMLQGVGIAVADDTMDAHASNPQKPLRQSSGLCMLRPCSVVEFGMTCMQEPVMPTYYSHLAQPAAPEPKQARPSPAQSPAYASPQPSMHAPPQRPVQGPPSGPPSQIGVQGVMGPPPMPQHYQPRPPHRPPQGEPLAALCALYFCRRCMATVLLPTLRSSSSCDLQCGSILHALESHWLAGMHSRAA